MTCSVTSAGRELLSRLTSWGQWTRVALIRSNSTPCPSVPLPQRTTTQVLSWPRPLRSVVEFTSNYQQHAKRNAYAHLRNVWLQPQSKIRPPYPVHASTFQKQPQMHLPVAYSEWSGFGSSRLTSRQRTDDIDVRSMHAELRTFFLESHSHVSRQEISYPRVANTVTACNGLTIFIASGYTEW